MKMGKESRIALEIRASGADILEGLFPGASPKVLWSMPIYNFAISYGKSAAGQKDACPRTFWRQGKFILKCIVCLLSYMTTLQMASAQDVIDVHAHIIPQLIGVGKAEHHNALMAEGFPLPKWTIENQLKWMDDAGVRTSVLSLAAPQPYFGDAKESAIIVRQLNEERARAKAEHHGRFLWCATLPLPDVEAAIQEAEYALDCLHADGIKLATNVLGQYLGSPELDPLLEVLNGRHAVILLHPHKPEPVNAQVMHQTPLAMQEYLSETIRSVCNQKRLISIILPQLISCVTNRAR